MSVKIYRPADSLQVYVQKDTETNPRLVTATHLRIYTSDSDGITVRDELMDREVISALLPTEILDETDTPMADFAAALTYLDKIIG